TETEGTCTSPRVSPGLVTDRFSAFLVPAFGNRTFDPCHVTNAFDPSAGFRMVRGWFAVC
ncbi:MAG: hypothetical protein EB039_07950, partial [Proteobacteria bacterium]|nr:hypothetical protein [Pseudomonadota bacterium]